MTPGLREYDYVAVGGGLQSALLVLTLRAQRPQARIAVIEQGPRLGGNHTWSFHGSDLDAAAQRWIQPLVVHRWEGYDVRFPEFTSILDRSYMSINTARLHDVVQGQLAVEGSDLFTGCVASGVHSDRVVLEDGRELRAGLVIDARGPDSVERPAECGFQKFLGQELRLTRDHGLQRPILMDACVDQTHGYHFVYALPIAPDRLLVEDTFFNTSPEIHHDQSRRTMQEWCEARGWHMASVEREEEGVLPMPWSGSLPATGTGPIRGGYAGGWFHPGTGFSLPVAARLAQAIASLSIADIRAGGLRPWFIEQQRQSEYCHFLNRLLFRWYPPHMRQHIFARFYRLPDDLIERFYALRLKPADRLRLVVGQPPRGFSPRYRMGAAR